MAKLTEWVEVEPQPEAPPRPECPIGPHAHQWVLCIEEGQPSIRLAEGEVCPTWDREGWGPMPVCSVWVGDIDHELVYMAEIPVRIELVVEVCGWETPEYNAHLNIEPREAA